MRKLYGLLLGLLFVFSQTTFAQIREVSGKVTDSKTGQPIDGVTVAIKGTDRATTTSADGSFRLAVSGDATLVFSNIAYTNQEVKVADIGASGLDIKLVPSSKNLDEVVVVGYGTLIKRDLASSIAKVRGTEVANTPVPNMTQALQGRAAGVFVESENGKVGEGIKVRIRGQSSISASNSPLYVVDGIPIITGSLSGNALADINFNDIESFEILKDAAATAIYGSRAGNGVVLITTKKGKAGKTQYNVNLQYGINEPTRLRGFLNAAEYVEFFREAAVNTAKYHYNRAGNWAGYSSEQEAIDDLVGFVEGRFTRYSGYSSWQNLETNTNWEKEAFQDAKTGLIEVSAQGGSDRTKYYISGSFNSQDGILIGNFFKRVSGRINLEQILSDKLKIGVNMALSKTDANRVPQDNAFATPMQLVAMAPITPTRDQNGVLYDRPTTTYYNGLLEIDYAHYNSTTYRNVASVFGQYNFMKNLFFRTELGIDIASQNDDIYQGSRTFNGSATDGYGQQDWLRNSRFTSNNYFNYRTVISDVHSIDATLGAAFENTKSEFSTVSGEQFPSDDLRTLASAGKITVGSSTISRAALNSFFGRVNYKFSNKYIVGLSARYDGGSVFGEDRRWGFFPGISAAWVISEENFMQNTGALSFLKLRASYGRLGNSAGFDPYGSQSRYGIGKYAGSSILAPITLGNTDFTWETTIQTDIGVEFGLFNNKVSGEIDVYRKASAGDGAGFIINYPIPATTGFTGYIKNIGEIENKGIELTLNALVVNNRDFKWTTSFNMSRNWNKVLVIDGDQDTLSFNDGRYFNALIVGQPIGVFYGQKYAGVDPNNGDALYYLQDGKSTTNDYLAAGQFVVGDPNPKWFGGWTNTFSYKGLELNVLLQAVLGYQVVNGAGGFMSARGDWFDNQTRDQLRRWKQPGDVTDIPEARINAFGDFISPPVSTQYMEDAGYIRLKNVTLGYNLPQNILTKLKMSSVRVYVTGINLAVITDYTGWDPEVNTDYRAGTINQGGDFYAAPQIKSWAFGVNIGF